MKKIPGQELFIDNWHVLSNAYTELMDFVQSKINYACGALYHTHSFSSEMANIDANA